MNYYEELGIRPDADEEEIRKAHRRLVKLMHPDQHRDAGLKALAETQMRRLNSIVATLLDPDERHEYDDSLRGGGSDAANAGQPHSNWKAVPWWIASTLGAIILTVGTLWFFADRIGSGTHRAPKVDIGGGESTTPPVEPPPVVNPPVKPVLDPPKPVEAEKDPPTVARVPLPAPVTTPAPTTPPVTVVPPPAATKKPEVAKITPPPASKPPVIVPKKPEVVVKNSPPPAPPVKNPPVKNVPAQMAQLPATPPVIKPKIYIPPAISAVPTPKKDSGVLVAGNPPNSGNEVAYSGDLPRPDYSTPPPPKVVPLRGKNDPLEGEWVYAPTSPEKPRAGVFPPEFIDLKLMKDQSGMKGEYSARYNVNRPVSPDVNFELVATDQTAMKYQWKGPNGAFGWLEIKDLETDTMRLVWKDTSKHGSDRLASGQATLVRKN